MKNIHGEQIIKSIGNNRFEVELSQDVRGKYIVSVETVTTATHTVFSDLANALAWFEKKVDMLQTKEH